MKKFFVIIGLMIFLFPSISLATAMEKATVSTFFDAPRGNLISGSDGKTYVAFTLEEYSEIIDIYKSSYFLKLKLLEANNTIDFLNDRNNKLHLSLSDLRYNYFSIAASKERQRKRNIITTITIPILTGIAGAFIGATIEKTNGK